MKKKSRLLLVLSALAVLLLVCLLCFGRVCIGRIENRDGGQWSQVHLYMNGETAVAFPVTGEDQLCVFQWESGRGSFRARITDADGQVVCSVDSDGTGAEAFPADSDLTLHIDADGHGGVFALFLRDDPGPQAEPDPEVEPDPEGESEPKEEPEPYLLLHGTFTGSRYTETYECRSYDGKYLNFFVENLGEDPVVITINGEYRRTIPAGSSGHITGWLGATVVPQPMTVKCVSETGGDIHINWSVAQRGK